MVASYTVRKPKCKNKHPQMGVYRADAGAVLRSVLVRFWFVFALLSVKQKKYDQIWLFLCPWQARWEAALVDDLGQRQQKQADKEMQDPGAEGQRDHNADLEHGPVGQDLLLCFIGLGGHVGFLS